MRLKSPEMDSCAQAAHILKKLVKPGDKILDIGCGTGYLLHSLKKIGVNFEYYGIDANNEFIEIGKEYSKKKGLNSKLFSMRIEDFRGKFDHIVCLNFLSNLDNYHKILERLLLASKKTVLIRESLSDKSEYNFVTDDFLDPKRKLSVYVNTYSINEVKKFIKKYGFSVTLIKDNRVKDKFELVIGYRHYWKFMLAKKND